MQYVAPEEVSYGGFCWNEECQYCRVTFYLGEGTPLRTGVACKLAVQEGLRVKEVTAEIEYCLRGIHRNP